ncbi:hypothetical protein [Massilia rhizosphaerae]|uniref:hypothetical protein n=1 Tax=Massilia rhizosphaerae TaxID=2784389 RepID=UPI0018DE7B0D|nr:hypothetical protein [Massilia rhizosphaerae]
MLNTNQSIDDFETNSKSLAQSNKFPGNKSNIGPRLSQHPIQLTLPHFAPAQYPEPSTPRTAGCLPKRSLFKKGAQHVLPDQHQLSFQFFGSNSSVGAEE